MPPKGSLSQHKESASTFVELTVDAEMITKLIPLTIFRVTEVITQIKSLPQEIFLCNRLAIARLNYTQEHPLHYTNSFA